MKRFLLLCVIPCLLLMSGLVWPLIRGSDTLVLRDTLNVHYPMKATQAGAMCQGYFPLLDPYRAGGQALLGNPNSVALYPDNLLYLVARPLWALNAHFWIHFLLAPLACFWLGRAWGLSRPASWIAGVTYGLSGFLFSQLNLYNLVAGAALAPAFVAACLWAARRWASGPAVGQEGGTWVAGQGGGTCQEAGTGPAGTGGALPLVAVALLWTLLLLAGDPMVALQAFVLASTAVLMAGAVRLRSAVGWRGLGRILAAVACGTLLAAPQLVEFLRILGLSYRGYWGFSSEWSLMASWNPVTVLEWFLPAFYGRPELQLWGRDLFAGHLPLFFSLYPGLLALALVLASGRPRGRRVWWAWGAVGVGLFLALGAWNPIVRFMMTLPGAGLLRFPVKLWLLVAVGGAMLCGTSFERTLERGREHSPGRSLAWALGGLAVLYGLLWGGLTVLSASANSLLRRWIPDTFPDTFVDAERSRWAGLCLLSLLVLGLLAAGLRLTRRRPELAAAALGLIHVACQLFFLRVLLPTDDARQYQTPPPLLAVVGEDERLAHGAFSDMFGKSTARPKFPDGRIHWVERRGWNELYPFAGAVYGRHYELNISPEGLDSFFTLAAFQILEFLPDSERVRVLAATGVDVLLLDREIEPQAASQVRLRRRHPSFEAWIYVYEVLGAAHEVQLLGEVLRAPHMNAAVATIADAGFDPRRTVVLPGPGPELRGPGGRATVLGRSPESLRVAVESEGPAVLVVQRSYLPLYRATLDGEPVPLTVANLSRLAVEVPAGKHEVRLWIDRRALWFSLLGIPLGLVGLWVVAKLGGGAGGGAVATRSSNRSPTRSSTLDPEPGPE